MSALLRVVRGLCGLIAAWHALGLALLALNPAPLLNGLWVLPASSLILTVLCGWLFFWLRGVINRMYAKRHGGATHPSLHSAWSL